MITQHFLRFICCLHRPNGRVEWNTIGITTTVSQMSENSINLFNPSSDEGVLLISKFEFKESSNSFYMTYTTSFCRLGNQSKDCVRCCVCFNHKFWNWRKKHRIHLGDTVRENRTKTPLTQ